MILDIVGLQKQKKNDSDCRFAKTSPRNSAALWLTRSVGRFQKKSAEMFQDRNARRWGNIEATKRKFSAKHLESYQILLDYSKIPSSGAKTAVWVRATQLWGKGEMSTVWIWWEEKAKKKFKFFLIFFAVWIWWEEKQKRKLLSFFSNIFKECCLNMVRGKSKKGNCFLFF